MIGSGHLFGRPEFIMDHDVIFVTFNYRLGMLGFLSTEDDIVPDGNNGMKDQVMALRWIQENIGSFGGNPDSVTITGISAGGASVHLHYFSEMSKGLSHKGFSQSGVALNPWVLQKNALMKARTVAEAVGCPSESSGEMVKCLKQRPYKQLVDKTNLFFGYLFFPVNPFAPIVEKGDRPFLKDYPYNLVKKEEVLDLPWIASSVAHEGSFPTIYLRQDLETVNSKWKEVAPLLLDFNYTLSRSLWNNISEEAKDLYFGKDQDINVGSFPKLLQMCSDRHFLVDAEHAVRRQAKVTKSPVYYQWFSYLGDNNKDKYVGHGADAKYYFGIFLQTVSLIENELKMKDVVLEMLISFAKTGKPEIKGVTWKPTSSEKLTYLNISSFQPDDIHLQTADNLIPGRFWNSLAVLEREFLNLPSPSQG